MASTPRMTELVSIIQTSTSQLSKYLANHGKPQPSFNIDAPADLGIPHGLEEIEAARTAALSACMELHDLLLGPRKLMTTIINPTALQAIYRLDIASKFPVGEEISYEDLARRCELREHEIRSIIRYAIVHHRVFQESRDGFVIHSAASRLLAENANNIREMVGLTVEEWAPAYSKTVDAMLKFPDRNPNETGFSLANNTDKPFYAFLSQYPLRVQRFAASMSQLSKASGAQVQFLIDSYQWADLGSGTVVDVGGSQGHVSIKIAEAHRKLKFVIQDLPEVVSGADKLLPVELGGRFTFMAHNLFDEQKIQGDVYLLRYILHNWPDDYCVRILRALIPAMTSRSRILISDHVVPGLDVLPLSEDRDIRAMDLRMMMLQNARERELRDWQDIIREADPRFFIAGVKLMGQSITGLIEVGFNHSK
ncbi:sterigmatocystin 8-O-methyltransferase [Trichoderma velutinum]